MDCTRQTVCVLALALLGGCDTTKLVADGTPDLFQRAAPAIEQHWDYDLVGKAIPAGIIQAEGVLRIVPDNQRVVMQTIGSYLAYTFGWLQDRMEEADANDEYEEHDHLRRRVNKMYLRAWDLGRHLLHLEADGFDEARVGLESLRAWLSKNFVRKSDAEVLLWAGQAWAGFIYARSGSTDAIADLPLAKEMVAHSVKLDPEFLNMTGMMFLAVFACQEFPPDMDKSKAMFEEIFRRTERRTLLTQVSMARFYAVANDDKAMFERLLNEVLAAGDVFPEARMANTIARRRAKRYLRLADRFFTEIEE